KVEAVLRVVSPEAALDAPCPGYRPVQSGSPAKRSASRGKVEAVLRVVSPEAALDAPCPGYRPVRSGCPAKRSASRGDKSR
ncbi:hypothetical protein PTQ49_28110, partial [Klebsiella pasteurii]|uniref:hypothetical protein n=1 Tax=Klebsiella pasteurii TaxID=2587529 RepID=UPI00287DDD9E